METEPRLGTITEAAAVTHKHPVTLRRWVATGLVAGWKVRGHLLVDLDEVESVMHPVPVIPRNAS